jgi:hypothetical protein
MTEREELEAVEGKIDQARTALDAAEQVWLQAQRRFREVTRPLYQARGTLLCNSNEWPEDGDGGQQA